MDNKKLSRITDSIEKDTERRFWDLDERRWVRMPVQLGDYVKWKDLKEGENYYFRYGRAFDNEVDHIKVYLKNDEYLIGLKIPQFNKAPKWARDVIKEHDDINWYIERGEGEEDHKLAMKIIKEANFEDWKNVSHTVDKYTRDDIMSLLRDYVHFFKKDPSRESIKTQWGHGLTGKFYKERPRG